MPVRDDITPTNPEPIEVLGAQLEVFRKEPDDADLFFELRTALRKSGQAQHLAEICELRAPLERDRRKAADILSEAGEARFLLGHDREGELALRRALELDPANERAAARLSERLMVGARFAEAAELMEAELEELARRAADGDERKGRAELNASRRATRHRMLAQLWDERLGRVDRALEHWQKAWQLEPDRPEALEAARGIYASLGDEKMVARLFEAELEVLGESGPRRRRASIHLELGRIRARQGDAMAAANHLELALRLDPESQQARESLAEIYASPSFEGKEERQRRASELFVELGRKRLETQEGEAAIGYLRRALGVDPYSRAGTEQLERALEAAERWDELERLYRHQADGLEDPRERLALLAKRGRLYEQHLDDRDAYKEVLRELCAHHPPLSEFSRRLRQLYRDDQEWPALATLMEAELPALEHDPRATCDELLELATIYREHLADRERAAEYLHRILSIDPRHDEAQARYGDHFRERRDWRGLADLLEFALEQAREGGAAAGELVRQLEEIAQVAELRLGDIEWAISSWNRIQELEPDSAKPREALRRLMQRAKMWESLVGVLEQEAAAAQTPHQRAEALRRIGQVYRERQVNPRRAIALYEEVVQMFPDDEGALKALAELYEREGDDAGLAHTMRRQLELDGRRMAAEAGAQGRAPTAREWPVAKRAERLTALRRLASMYEQRLADVEGVVFACTGILEILPGDRDGLERMERVLEKAGDLQRLEQTLEYHAASATGPAEKAKVLRKLARLAAEQNDEVRAMERWEQVIKAAPNDGDALQALAGLYERHTRWGELATVLERILMTGKPPEPGSPEAEQREEQMRRYARVVDRELGDAARATRAWQKVVEQAPRDREALEALSRLYEGAGRWRDLAEILAQQAPLYIDDEPDTATAIALRRAQLLEERLGAPADAIKTLEALISSLDPANLDAHKALRRLYEARGDFEAAVRIAEREMYLSEEPGEKIARGLEIGLLCRDRLNDPTRALQAFERVLQIDPRHEEALGAAADLYQRVEDWERYLKTLERRIELTPEGRQRRALMTRIAQTTAERLGDHAAAFAWLRRAHEHAPDATTISELRRAAEAYGLWRELADVYDGEREALLPGGSVAPTDRAAYVNASRELAAIAERRLGNRQRALTVLLEALEVAPEDESLLTEAERIAVEADQTVLWKLLLDCMEVPLRAADRDGKVALHQRRARVLEERLGDARGAVEELLQGFAWAPERDETRRALYELAERTRAWTDVVAVETALLGRAREPGKRVEILRRRAQIIEERLHESVRAFRTHLLAFLIDPEDSETTAHLWRLAKSIDRYRESDRTPAPEPPPAYVHPADAAPARRLVRPAATPAPLRIEAATPTREATQELSVTDLIEARGGTAGPAREDQTQPIDISDLQPAAEDTGDVMIAPPPPRAHIAASPASPDRSDATIELRTEDLIQALGGRAAPQPPQPPAAPPPPRRAPGAAKAPPPPPPRPPAITRQNGKSPAPRRGTPRPTTPPARRVAPVPQLPVRAYASPWEEFATAYEILDAPNPAARLRWLFRAAEVWETGAADIGRAFDTLARALELSDDDAEPRARLHRLAADHDAWDRLAALYEAAAEDADNAEQAVNLLMEVAEIRSRQDRPRETEAIYRRVLGMRPDDAVARERLEALYRGEDRWIDLAASLEERTDPRLGTAAPEAERPALLLELAGIYRDRLRRPHDAIDALERLRQLDSEDTDVLEQLADLYGEVGRWSKVIEMLGRIGDVTTDPAKAREALRRVAHIYEAELELPDRAIDAYSQMIAQWPDDAETYAALDRLYLAHARWHDLSETLRRRAALTRDSRERADLLRRRAEVLLEWLDTPEEAAAVLRHARTVMPDDASLADALVQALIKAGREREAAAVLEGRISALSESGGGAGDLAALLIRLATLRADHLDKPEAAKRALEEALALVPNHPTALATMARLAQAENPRAYAEARLREAEVLEDVDARVAAYMDAGEALRDRAADIDGARHAFQAALTLRPYHSTATWALAGLVEQGGNLDSAAMLLEKRLEDEALDAEEKARIYTQLAALARRAGVDAAAERRLYEALETVPEHLPAVIAMADLLAESERWDGLEHFLTEALPQLAGAPPAARAELQRRLAIAYEKLGRDDDAYQLLLTADRTHRGHLLVKLALGENRYRARRWREAALHLSALATHEEAAEYPAEVAAGLYHAALAEIRSLRPEKAPALYERALELKPNYAPALHALAEQAMEQGEVKRAADLLTRQAMATEDSAERMRLFEALGDMAVMALHDEDRARVCYEAAVNAADPLEAKHLPLLEKLLERQDLAADHLGAARTAELMASFGADARARAARFTAAAESYAAAGELERARSAAERAVEAHPHDLDAVTVLSDLLLRAGDHEAAAAVLGRALSTRDEDDELLAPRKALLWQRLADARHARGDVKGATTAYEKAIALAGDSDGAMAARRVLLDVWKDVPERAEQLIEYRRTLAADTMEVGDVLGYGRALAAAGRGDEARVMLELAQCMDHAPTDADQATMSAHPRRVLAADEAYRGVVTEAQRAELVADDDDQPLASIMTTLWEAAALLWSEPDDALERCGVIDARRLSAKDRFPAAAMFPGIASALGLQATVQYVTTAPDAPDVQVVCVSAPIVVFGPRLHGNGDRAPSDGELRFLLGRAAELARPERIVATGLPREDFVAVLESIARVFGSKEQAARATNKDDQVAQIREREHDELLRTTLPVKLRTRLKELLAGAGPADLDADRYLAACSRAADRAGALVSGDVVAAVRSAGSMTADGRRLTRHILALPLRPSYLDTRRALGLAVDRPRGGK